MKITFDLDIDDILAFQNYQITHSEAFKRRIVIIRFFALMIALFILVYSYGGKFNMQFVLLIVILVLIVGWWFSFVPKIIKSRALSKNRKRLQKQKETNPALFSERSMTFTDEDFFLENEKTSLTMKWSAIDRVVRDADYAFLFCSNSEVFIIPYRKLTTENAQRVNAFINTKFD